MEKSLPFDSHVSDYEKWLRALAVKRGLEVIDGLAEQLPYGDLRFDFVLMAFCISYFNNLHVAFKETYRVLKKNRVLVLASSIRTASLESNTNNGDLTSYSIGPRRFIRSTKCSLNLTGLTSGISNSVRRCFTPSRT